MSTTSSTTCWHVNLHIDLPKKLLNLLERAYPQGRPNYRVVLATLPCVGDVKPIILKCNIISQSTYEVSHLIFINTSGFFYIFSTKAAKKYTCVSDHLANHYFYSQDDLSLDRWPQSNGCFWAMQPWGLYGSYNIRLARHHITNMITNIDQRIYD